jgi:hypothetical protein
MFLRQQACAHHHRGAADHSRRPTASGVFLHACGGRDQDRRVESGSKKTKTVASHAAHYRVSDRLKLGLLLAACLLPAAAAIESERT